MAETKAVSKDEEKVVERAEKKTKPAGWYTVTIDNSAEDVIKLDQDGYELAFDLDRFLKLSDETVDQLGRRNYANYCIAENQIAQRELKTKRRPDVDYVKEWNSGNLNLAGGNARRRMQKALRERPGWHGCLKAPDEKDEALNAGYRFIRHLSTKQEKAVKDGKATREDFLGEEDGEIVKLGQEDKPELIAMEIPESRWKEHLAWVGWQSKGRFERAPQEYAEKVRRAGLLPTNHGEVIKE